jgi:hypothetical protein
MLFLIEYSRSQGKLISLKSFPDTEWNAVMDERLELELDLFHRKVQDHDALVFQSDSLETLKVTHGNYFKTLEELFDELVNEITSRGKFSTTDSFLRHRGLERTLRGGLDRKT